VSGDLQDQPPLDGAARKNAQNIFIFPAPMFIPYYLSKEGFKLMHGCKAVKLFRL
jgi:hypothetical protein